MKIGALVIGLIGSFVVAIVGLIWIDQSRELGAGNEGMGPLIAAAEASGDPRRIAGAQELRASLARTEKQGRAGTLMASLGVVSFAATFLVFRRPKVSGAFMTGAAVAPALLVPGALIFGFLLLLAALLAFRAPDGVRGPLHLDRANRTA